MPECPAGDGVTVGRKCEGRKKMLGIRIALKGVLILNSDDDPSPGPVILATVGGTVNDTCEAHSL